nr:MAG: hypothetical protein [unidentified adenovirus]
MRSLAILLLVFLACPYLKGSYYGTDFGSGEEDELVDEGFTDCELTLGGVCTFLENPGGNFSFALVLDYPNTTYIVWTHNSSPVLKLDSNRIEVSEGYRGRAAAEFHNMTDYSIVYLHLLNLTTTDQGLHFISQINDSDVEPVYFAISFAKPSYYTTIRPPKTVITGKPLNDYSEVFYVPENQHVIVNVSERFPSSNWGANNTRCSLYFRDYEHKIVTFYERLRQEFWMLNSYFKVGDDGSLYVVVMHVTTSDQGLYILQCDMENYMWVHKFLIFVMTHPEVSIWSKEGAREGVHYITPEVPVTVQGRIVTGSFVFFMVVVVLCLVGGIAVFVYVLHKTDVLHQKFGIGQSHRRIYSFVEMNPV